MFMKVQKLFSLDAELVERLRQEDNASALVNSLLTSHYGDTRTEAEVLADVQNKIKADEESIAHDKEFAKNLKKRTTEGIKNYNKTHKTKWH